MGSVSPTTSQGVKSDGISEVWSTRDTTFMTGTTDLRSEVFPKQEGWDDMGGIRVRGTRKG